MVALLLFVSSIEGKSDKRFFNLFFFFFFFLVLANNCPFIGNTIIEKSFIEKFAICRDSSMDTITLMINTVTKEQYKILLEQKSTCYTFPADTKSVLEQRYQRESESEWEVVSSSSSADLQEKENTEGEASSSTGGSDLKSRLSSLRDLGAKKIANLKMKLSEGRIIKAREKEKLKNDQSQYSIMNAISIVPEPLTTPSGPFFIMQKSQNKNLMSALHPYSDTLSVSKMKSHCLSKGAKCLDNFILNVLFFLAAQH